MPIKHQTQSQITLTSRTENSKKFSNPPWWNRRTRLERTLIILLFVCSCFVIAFLNTTIYFGYHLKEQSISALKNVCLTPGCVQAASDIISNLNETVNPCDDFYEFACGGWLSKQIINEDRTSVSHFSKLGEDLNLKLKRIIEDENSRNEFSYMKKIKTYYNSCKSTRLIEEQGNKPIINVLNKIGGWPVLTDKWDESKFNWLDTLIKFRQIGYSHDILFDISVTTDFRNNTRHIIEVDQASLGMPDRSYILRGNSDPLVKGYIDLMVKSAVMLGANETKARTDLKKAFEFESLLANISVPREERRNYSTMYNKMSIKDIQKIAKNTNWLKLFKQILGQRIDENQEIIVQVPKFVVKLDKILSNYSKKDVANYMAWRVVSSSMMTLHKGWIDNFREFTKILTGQDKEEPRWEQCLEIVNNIFGIGLSSVYVRNHFNPESKKNAMTMVTYIRNEFIQILNELDWMDKKTVDYAIAKAKAIKTYIGYPDQLLNESLIEDFYKNLQLDKESYLENMLAVNRWALDYSFSHLHKPSIQTDWKKHSKASTINAFYNLVSNSIEFPAGILQGVFFNANRPNYINYASIGYVIGHELTHGFDDRGKQFDKEGNNVNWWRESDSQTFKKRVQCIIDQYNNYTLPEAQVKINGLNTQGENIADNGGLKESFRAYQKWVLDSGDEPSLPGLKYTNNQLFWISAANIWCSKTRPEFSRYRTALSSHSPSRFRVIGPMSNLKEFSESFNCKIGDKMNPVKKCTVW